MKESLSERFDRRNLIGRSLAMTRLIETVSQVAPTEATVLITGESGTGKEMIAGLIHYNSLRKDGPFIRFNCAAIAETLLESELFGHEKGAFTGADRRKEGKFRQADGGSLFLDEVSEMSVGMQVKLLRVLQERELTRVGGEEVLKVDVRVIAATDRDLLKEVGAGRFREDLLYRLNVVMLQVPPLRERPEDIPLLAQEFLVQFAGKNHKAIKGFTPQAMNRLLRTVRVTRGDTVIVDLESTDVVHGLYVDGYDVATQAEPGRSGQLTFIADRDGAFRFRCNVACGGLHPFMIGKLVVGPNLTWWRAIAATLITAVGAIAIFWRR